MVPYADFNLLKFRRKDQALAEDHRSDAALGHLPDRLSRRVTAGVTTGSMVYVAGGGPVGLAPRSVLPLLGAAVVIVGDMNPERLAQARSFGCETIDLRRTPRWRTRSSRSSASGRSGLRGRLRGL